MNTIIQDLRYGFRLLAKSPGFTAVAIITLALGIGANTAMFSVVYGVLLKPLPYLHPERIVEISATYRGQTQQSGFTASAFDSWQQHSRPFQYLAASTSDGFNLAGAGRPERVSALRVSLDYFHVFGVQPFLGRSFNAQEEQIGGPNVAILSYGLWKEHLAGDPRAIGRTILLNGTPYTVIGVMPAGFVSILPSSPLQTAPVTLWTTIGQVRNTAGSGQNYDVIGRLNNDVSRRRADAYLAGISHSLAEQFYQWWPERIRQAIGFVGRPLQQCDFERCPDSFTGPFWRDRVRATDRLCQCCEPLACPDRNQES